MSRFPTYRSKKSQWVTVVTPDGQQKEEWLDGDNIMVMMGLGFPKQSVQMPFLLADKIYYLFEDQVEKTSGGTGLPPFIPVKTETFF